MEPELKFRTFCGFSAVKLIKLYLTEGMSLPVPLSLFRISRSNWDDSIGLNCVVTIFNCTMPSLPDVVGGAEETLASYMEILDAEPPGINCDQLC